MEVPLPFLGTFDVVVSGFAIHHLTHERKRQLYEEIWTVLEPTGIFCNLEHVASVSRSAHERFLQAIGITSAEKDRSNKLLDCPHAIGVAARDWIRGCRLLLEMARAGSSRGPQNGEKCGLRCRCRRRAARSVKLHHANCSGRFRIALNSHSTRFRPPHVQISDKERCIQIQQVGPPCSASRGSAAWIKIWPLGRI